MRRLPALLVVALLALGAQGRPAGAVVGGREADPGEWPWQVALRIDGFFGCGGVLVSLDVVLTAAHCTEGEGAGDLDVFAGTTDGGGRGGVLRDVAEVVQHERYDPVESENDISILFLGSPFEASDTIAPVALPDAELAATLAGHGRPTVVTGYGAVTEEGDVSDVLREGDVEAIDDDVCEAWYAEEDEAVFGETQVCAGLDEGRVDACQGDSGGPLVAPALEGSEGDGWYLLGLVSWGDGCARPERPTVYTEVAAFIGWLDEHGATSVDGERFTSGGGALRVPAVGSRGKAARYPDVVVVPEGAGTVDGDVVVELHGLRHERPSDLDVWLEAPDGTVVTLLSDVGGDEPLVDADLVVTAAGAVAGDRPLPRLVAPADLGADDQRKDGAPPADLRALDGVDAAGEWRLLVADDRGGATGSLEGWTLILP